MGKINEEERACNNLDSARKSLAIIKSSKDLKLIKKEARKALKNVEKGHSRYCGILDGLSYDGEDF